jgi:hypothetical protein
MAVKKLLALAAAGEVTVGLVLLMHPPIVVRLLFGAEIAGVGPVMGRVAGLALIGLGIACWPARERGIAFAPAGMLTYSVTVTLYLTFLGLSSAWVGKLLWPAVAVHALLSGLLARAWLRDRQVRDPSAGDAKGR